MKYEYDGMDASDIIDNYKKKTSKIVITFLDGSTKTVPLNNKQEEKIKNMMLKQATDRNNNSSLNTSKSGIKLNTLTYAYFVTFPIIFTLCLAFNPSYDSSKTIYNTLIAFVIGISSIGIYLSDNEIKLSNEEVNDIKKYSIYLANRKKIEDNKDNPSLYKNVKNKGTLDINTLDNYTLSDMLKIEKNLLKIKKIDNPVIEDDDLEEQLRLL